MLGIFERVLGIDALPIRRLKTVLHHHAMWNDVEISLLEIPHLILRFADDHFDDGALHPLGLTTQLVQGLLARLALVRITRRELSFFQWNRSFHSGKLSDGPWLYVKRFENISELPNVTHGLIQRGWSSGDIRKILGGNWLRVYEAVWGS